MKLHTKILAFLVGILVLVNLSSIAMAEEASIDVNPMCKDANVLSNVFTQVSFGIVLLIRLI
ncbi:hypothetical protein L3081_24290 [Colwellia sp. MSW7]|uniref:Uncharacterized protein n=1 Tax=Colwellia maritima TaxID=2912588 RepID=A0ABS9X6U3_9GAMM|nr:hypothetical protein [Colwellia maritima]MCI2285949.1 hypothetical protein [Colwellia maritima]